MSNTELWDSVEKTDPRFTKKVNQRGGFTAIGAQYQMRKATESFGPYGIGWGVKEESFERYEDTGLVLYQGTLWYKHGKAVGTVPIHSSIKYHSNNRVDDDFAKKVATDALTKGLSRLGFNADVFMGLFDDNKHVAEMNEKFGNGQTPQPPAPRKATPKANGNAKLNKEQRAQVAQAPHRGQAQVLQQRE
mgnify:CR=1 FL=1